jgi:hypothetical protein
MLNHLKLMQEIKRIEPLLSNDQSSLYGYVAQIWEKMCKEPMLLQKVEAVESLPWPVPLWQEELHQITLIEQKSLLPYVVCAIDGSQIYPDRHQPVGCFLINIGIAQIMYGHCIERSVDLVSDPYLIPITNAQHSSVEYVNCLRHQYELEAIVKQGIRSNNHKAPFLVLLDGSLIFWHLEARVGLKDLFLSHYFVALESAFDASIWYASYISAPKSKELINLMRLFLANFDPKNSDSFALIDQLIDTVIVKLFLPPRYRTTIFENRSDVRYLYPAALVPHFFYLNVGAEIARVELPAWLAYDAIVVDRIASIIIDQAMNKGQGYPVILAESHEQAVIKGADRDLFYHLMNSMTGNEVISSKLRLKRRANC